MKNTIFDSYAVLAYLSKHPGYEQVMDALEKAALADKNIFITALGWAEVRCVVERSVGENSWHQIQPKLIGLPLEVVAADKELAEKAGALKIRNHASLVVCFSVALAKLKKAVIYTGDPAFKCAESECHILWLT